VILKWENPEESRPGNLWSGSQLQPPKGAHSRAPLPLLKFK